MSSLRTLLTLALASVLCVSAPAWAAKKAPAVLADITVEAGDHPRVETPVSVALPQAISPWQPLTLVEVTGDGERPVPSQVEAGREEAGPENEDAAKRRPPRLWFTLSGSTKAGETRRYELRRGGPPAGGSDPAPAFGDWKMIADPDGLGVALSGQPFFFYNHDHISPPKELSPAYLRSGFIHPLRSPSGKRLTHTFPEGHPHQYGVWVAWKKAEYEGHTVDFWDLAKERGTVRFAGYLSMGIGPVWAGFRARHHHVDLTQGDSGEIALKENWRVRVYNIGESGESEDPPDLGVGPYRLFDLTSTQWAVSSPLRILEYHYGGLSVHFSEQWTPGENYEVLTSRGKTWENAHKTRARWVANSGKVDGQWATVVVMCHPDNERYPEPIRSSAEYGPFLSYAPTQLGDWTFQPGERHTFRYRFLIYDGRIDAEVAERAWRAFAHPPRVTIERRR